MAIEGVAVPTLICERLILQPLSAAHSAGMFAMWSQAAVCEYSGVAYDVRGEPIVLPARTPADSDKIIDFFVKSAAAGTRFRWALVTASEGEFIGAAGFNALGACSEYAYHQDPSFWGQGFMTEASQAAFDWLRTQPGCEEVEAFIEPANKASIGLATRLGLRATGALAGGAERYAMSIREWRTLNAHSDATLWRKTSAFSAGPGGALHATFPANRNSLPAKRRGGRKAHRQDGALPREGRHQTEDDQ